MGGMDPMQMMMMSMMSGGQFSPAMMGKMNNNGDLNMLFNSMMMSMII
jgi:hypothetical protein